MKLGANHLVRKVVAVLASKQLVIGHPSSGLASTSPLKIRNFLLQFEPRDFGQELLRIGPNGDGGYLLPHDFEGISDCISPGYGGMDEFERDLWSRFSIRSHVVDNIQEFSKFSELENSSTSFSQGWVGLPIDSSRISLERLIQKIPSKDDLLLQMDIEGSEYSSLASLSWESLLRFRIMVIEFHNLYLLKNRIFFQEIIEPLFKTLSQFFDIVHVHPNNCCGVWNYGNFTFPKIIEVTFHRKDRRLSTNEGKLCELPNILDFPSDPAKPDLSLDFK